jgi:hypothetical protein
MPYVEVLLISSVAFATPFGLGLYEMTRDKFSRWLMLLYLCVPILGALFMAKIVYWLPFNVRYAVVALPAYILVLAVGITSIKYGLMRFILAVLLVALSIYALGNYFFDATYAKEDARSAAAYLETEVAESDVILVLEIALALEFYYDGPAEIRGISPYKFESTDRLQSELSHIAQGHDRVWLVWSRPWVDRESVVKRHFEARYAVVTRQDFHGIQVYGYALDKDVASLQMVETDDRL